MSIKKGHRPRFKRYKRRYYCLRSGNTNEFLQKENELERRDENLNEWERHTDKIHESDKSDSVTDNADTTDLPYGN